MKLILHLSLFFKSLILEKAACNFLIAVLFPVVLMGQDQDYYKKVLENATDKAVQLVALDSLLNKISKPDSECFEVYGRRYIRLAQELGQTENAAKKAIELYPILSDISGHPLNSIWIVDEVLAEKEKIQDSFLLGSLYLNRGNAFIKTDLNKAVIEYTSALDNFSESDTLPRADTHLLRGQAQSDRGKFAAAYEDYNTAYQLYESIGKHTSMVYAQQGISDMFSINGFYEKAREERKRLIETMQTLNLDSYLAKEHYNQAVDYYKMGNEKLEYRTLLIAESLETKHPSNKRTFIGIHSSLISYYSRNKQLDEAKKHLALLEAMEYDFENDLLSKINYLSGRIDYLLAIKEFDKALELTQDQLKASERLGREDKIMESHELLAEIYYQTDNLQESIVNSRLASSIKDSIYNKSAINALAYYQALYETEKKERELIEQATSISLLEKDNKNFKNAMLLGAIATILGFIVVVLYRNHFFMQNRKKLHERFSQKLLLSQESERKRISENLHDGVGQQLLVIKNRLVSSDDDESKNLIDAAIEEIRSISRDLHPFLLKELGVTKAIEYTINRIDENTKLFISSEIDNIDNILSKENEINIYRIVQESISNILKHAHADAAKIAITRTQNSIIITIRDNGVGFDFPKRYLDSKSLGLKTLMERIRFLNGQMKVTSKEGSGTLIEFQIPI